MWIGRLRAMRIDTGKYRQRARTLYERLYLSIRFTGFDLMNTTVWCSSTPHVRFSKQPVLLCCQCLSENTCHHVHFQFSDKKTYFLIQRLIYYWQILGLLGMSEMNKEVPFGYQTVWSDHWFLEITIYWQISSTLPLCVDECCLYRSKPLVICFFVRTTVHLDRPRVLCYENGIICLSKRTYQASYEQFPPQ